MLDETPRSHRSHVGKAEITVLRPVIAVEMDRVFVKVPIDSFMKTYLPFVPSEEAIKRIIGRLLFEKSYQPSPEEESSGEESSDLQGSLHDALRSGNSLMLRHDNRLMFRAFPQPPTQTNGSEKIVYAPLAKIAEEISQIKDLIPDRHDEYYYRDVSSKTIYSEIDGSNNKIDACFIHRDGSSQPAAREIAVVIEQKLVLEQRGGNNRQAVSANVQIMNDDVRRMFTFGITIESNLVTLWYHSRSYSAVSEQFSFVDQPEILLKVFTSFLYAKREELGYDPLVDYVGKGRYVFRNIPNVHDSSVLDTYKSIDTISEIRANNISGRMARVFTVVKYNQKAKRYGARKYVLKDVWLDDKAQTERQLQDAIFRDIDKFWTNSDTSPYLNSIKERHRNLVSSKDHKRHFLSIESDYDGQQSKLLPDDFQPVRGLLAGPPLEEEKNAAAPTTAARLATQMSKAAHTIPVDTAYENFARVDFERTYAQKKQYRVVFNELCSTVGQLDTLGEVIDVLRQSLSPLELMLCAGWVHRDISSGNIMAYRRDLDNKNQPWRVILADLEYAKKYPPPANYLAASDPKTGTPFFMPIEIMMQDTLFARHHDQSMARSQPGALNSQGEPPAAATARVSEVAEAEVQDTYKRVKKQRLLKDKTKDPSQGIIHNFQHDLESIWWLVLWTITSRVVGSSAQLYGEGIFQNSIIASPKRLKAFRSGIEEDLNSCLGKLAKYFSEPMETIRGAMYQDYVSRVREGNLTNIASFVPTSNAFRSFFSDLEESRDRWSATLLNAENPYIDPAERKRPLPDDPDEAQQDESEIEPKSKLPKISDSSKGMLPAE